MTAVVINCVVFLFDQLFLAHFHSGKDNRQHNVTVLDSFPE